MKPKIFTRGSFAKLANLGFRQKQKTTTKADYFSGVWRKKDVFQHKAQDLVIY